MKETHWKHISSQWGKNIMLDIYTDIEWVSC